MAGFLVCWAVRRLLHTGHNILSPKSLSRIRQPPANTDLMLLVATQSWHCASSCVSGYNQDNKKHNRVQTLTNKTKRGLQEAWRRLKRLNKNKKHVFQPNSGECKSTRKYVLKLDCIFQAFLKSNKYQFVLEVSCNTICMWDDPIRNFDRKIYKRDTQGKL